MNLTSEMDESSSFPLTFLLPIISRAGRQCLWRRERRRRKVSSHYHISTDPFLQYPNMRNRTRGRSWPPQAPGYCTHWRAACTWMSSAGSFATARYGNYGRAKTIRYQRAQGTNGGRAGTKGECQWSLVDLIEWGQAEPLSRSSSRYE